MASKKKPAGRKPVFAKDEMSTGRTSKLRQRIATVVAAVPTGSYTKLTVDPPRPSVSNDPVRDEIRYRERQATASVSAVNREKPKPPSTDLLTKQKMKEAEANLREGWDGEDPVDAFDEEEDTVPGLD